MYVFNYVQWTVHRITWYQLSNKMQESTVYLDPSTAQHVSSDISPIICSSHPATFTAGSSTVLINFLAPELFFFNFSTPCI